MSDSSDEDAEAESTIRMLAESWAEFQPGPSGSQPSRQGYCGFCQVLYRDLDEHLSSLKHLDSVRGFSRDSFSISSAGSRTHLTLLERFLQDVQKHHPHHYNDLRPSYADLPSVSAPPVPRVKVDDFCVFDDSPSLGTCEQLSISDFASSQPANQVKAYAHHQSSEGVTEKPVQERVSTPIRVPALGETAPIGYTHSLVAQSPSSHPEAPPLVHRKAHRKTNRRKASISSPLLHRVPNPSLRRDPGPQAPSELRPWRSQGKAKREAQREEVFSSDPLEETIEEVIQVCCYGVRSSTYQQDQSESLHFSLPVSMGTQSDDWDSPVQVALSQTPVKVSQTEEADLCRLMDAQVDLEDQLYSQQLDYTLQSWRGGESMAREDGGFWTMPIEEVLPAPPHIPESFRGKSWAQIEQEDEEKVERLVRQFRRNAFICYFDSESLARCGRKSQNKKGNGQNEGVEQDNGVPLSLDGADDELTSISLKRRKKWGFRLASRCQVVKVSHSTQTVQMVIPAVRQSTTDAPPYSIPEANQEAADRTPKVELWRYLPFSYSNIITPVQPRTSLVYLLSSPSISDPKPAAGSASKRSRKRRRPLKQQGIKFKYKRVPVKFYDPSSNRILKNAPRGSFPSGPPPQCVRQLFRSLSPDLNTDRLPGEGPTRSSRVKGQRSADRAFSQTNQKNTVRRRGRMSQAPSLLPHSKSERGRGRIMDRTHTPPSKKRTRLHARPLQPRREGVRRTGPGRKCPGSTGPPLPSSPRHGRGRKGRSCEPNETTGQVTE